MSTINHLALVVKLLESPKEEIGPDESPVVKVRVQIPQRRNTSLAHLIVWDWEGILLLSDHQADDFLLVEGSIGLHSQPEQIKKQVRILCTRIYPLTLNGFSELGY